MSEYKLSVVVLVYNTAEYLVECFDSLINQSLDGIEVIAINDESTDNSLDICLEYQNKYSNFKIIDQSNTGGATAGNRAMTHAKGKYVAIIDSDDLLPCDAYLKLYNAAEKESADIAMGRPMQYRDGKVKPFILAQEKSAWLEPRVLTSAADYPPIFFDGFYWNKIYLREFVTANEIKMPDGMLYADRSMVHGAYCYAKKITIITDQVYYWRRDDRPSVSHKDNTLVISNAADRVESFVYDYTNMLKSGRQDLLEYMVADSVVRLLFPLRGVAYSSEFRGAYLALCTEYLNLVSSNLTDYWLKPWQKVSLWLIKNKRYHELLLLVGASNRYRTTLDSGVLYWKPPFYEDESLDIPKECYRFNYIESGHLHGFKLLSVDGALFFQVNVSYFSMFSNIDKIVLRLERRDKEFRLDIPASVHGSTLSFKVNKRDILQKGYGSYFVYLGISQSGKEEFFQVSKKHTEVSFMKFQLPNMPASYKGRERHLQFVVLNWKGAFKHKAKKFMRKFIRKFSD
jgi:glycosyltransferase involved in cell wall biosynthesis